MMTGVGRGKSVVWEYDSFKVRQYFSVVCLGSIYMKRDAMIPTDKCTVVLIKHRFQNY